MILITNTGKEIECITVINSETYNYLEIITNSIELSDIFNIFANPEETEELTAIEGEDYHKVYRGFTYLDSFTRTALYTGNLDFSIKLRPQFE